MLRSFLSTLLCLSIGLLAAQDEVKDLVALSLKTGNSRELAKHFVVNIDLTLPGNSEVYSKAQAEQIMRKFFEEHNAKDLTIEHEGVSKMGDRYYIGRLTTDKGPFRVTFFLKKAGEVYLVKQLRIEAGKGDL